MCLNNFSIYELSVNYFFSVSQSHKYVNYDKVHLYPSLSLSLSFSVCVFVYLPLFLSLFHRTMKNNDLPTTFFLYPLSNILKLQVISFPKSFSALTLKYMNLPFSWIWLYILWKMTQGLVILNIFNFSFSWTINTLEEVILLFKCLWKSFCKEYGPAICSLTFVMKLFGFTIPKLITVFGPW